MNGRLDSGHLGGTLASRVAIAVGASRGIGWGSARRLAAVGATLVAAARTLIHRDAKGSPVATTQLIERRGGRAVAVEPDLQRAESRESLIAGTMGPFGRILIDFDRVGADLKEVLELAGARRIPLLPFETFHFERGREGLASVAAGGARGKIALVMDRTHAA
jgi:NAD(P)-dependent dehydrogenase (short-subunit alcohol dehydrogenase family)